MTAARGAMMVCSAIQSNWAGGEAERVRSSSNFRFLGSRWGGVLLRSGEENRRRSSRSSGRLGNGKIGIEIHLCGPSQSVLLEFGYVRNTMTEKNSIFRSVFAASERLVPALGTLNTQQKPAQSPSIQPHPTHYQKSVIGVAQQCPPSISAGSSSLPFSF